MAAISVGQAIGSGFRIIRREPKAVLTWWAAYLAFSVAMYGLILLGAPDLFSEYVSMSMSGGRASTEELTAITETMSHLWVFMPVFLVIGLAVMAVFLGAIYRAVLTPEDRRAAYLRFGRQELWLLLSMIVCGLVCLVIYVACIAATAMVVGILTTVLGAVSGGKIVGALLGIVLVIAAVLFVVWVVMRLALAFPISFEQARFVVFEGWRVSRGEGGRMLLVALGLLLVMIGLEVLVLIVSFAVGATMGPSVEAALAAGGGARLLPLLIAWAAVMSLVGVAFYVISAAPLADIWRQLKGEPAPAG